MGLPFDSLLAALVARSWPSAIMFSYHFPVSVLQSLLSFGTLVFLIAVLVFLVLLLITILYQFWWVVPFVPTPMNIVRTMVGLAKLRPGQAVVDLGAGDGRFLIEAKRREPRIHAIGYEGALLVWLLGKIRILLSGQCGIRLRCENLFNADLRDADVVFVYLSMHIMRRLLPKFTAELRPGTVVVSHAFRIPDLEPTRTARVPMRFGGFVNTYCYVWR